MSEEPKNRFGDVGTFQKLTRLLAAPVLEPSQRAARILAVEKDIVLPLRVLIIAILGYYFFFAGWFNYPSPNSAGEIRIHRHPKPSLETNSVPAVGTNQVSGSNAPVNVEARAVSPSRSLREIEDPIKSDWSLKHAAALKGTFVGYVILNLIVGAIFIRGGRLTLTHLEWIVFAAGTFDCALMGTLAFLNSGFNSLLYPVFAVLILHNALAIPVAFPQLLLNSLCIASFVIAGIKDRHIYSEEIENSSWEQPIERILVLVTWALCCYGIQVLFEKQKRAEAEATEFAVRQERLRTAGRLAAEIAHQIKNPLGIITNAAFCLNRAVHEGETAVDEQIQIIREEVDRADQIITELMGYAQLAEGKVEKLEVAEELDAAVQEVFPPAAKYRVAIHKDYSPALPALLMQKRHLSGVLVNILQNAREAMHGVGEVTISARYGENDSVCIAIADNGPGIAADKIDKIFEAYFTTREKGTGLGLAIVKHNTEMYGGKVDVESEIGKGTRFVLEFPARILMRLSK